MMHKTERERHLQKYFFQKKVIPSPRLSCTVLPPIPGSRHRPAAATRPAFPSFLPGTRLTVEWRFVGARTFTAHDMHAWSNSKEVSNQSKPLLLFFQTFTHTPPLSLAVCAMEKKNLGTVLPHVACGAVRLPIKMTTLRGGKENRNSTSTCHGFIGQSHGTACESPVPNFFFHVQQAESVCATCTIRRLYLGRAQRTMVMYCPKCHVPSSSHLAVQVTTFDNFAGCQCSPAFSSADKRCKHWLGRALWR
jgi:hypothetical protein